ncbi:MAG: hypothetical protein WCL50_06835 [Spirochaetota bacterium]
MKQGIFAIAAASGLALFLNAGCGSTDVVARVANSSFGMAIEASKGRVSHADREGAWVLASTAGDEVGFSSDFSRPGPDVTFSFDAAPFLAAGLDMARLSEGEGITARVEAGRLIMGFELGADRFAGDAGQSLAATMAEIVRTQRQRIGYHEKLDHYGIRLGGGNMFEWAKDPAKNDKDIVWALNPLPLIAAGVDPSKVAGWVFAKVESKDAKGKTVLEDKLLKPFDLR